MEKYDTIVLGGGIAGLTSALYTSRAGLKTLIIENKQLGGQIVNSPEVLNYPGFKLISGYDLIENIRKQVLEYGVEIVYEEVEEVSSDKIVTSNHEYSFKTLIVATGLTRKSLGVESDYVGRGVSYCATCDGNFFRGKDVAVVGGGNTALEEVLYLANIARKVYLIHRRDSFRGYKYLVDKVSLTNNVEIIYEANVKALVGNEKLERVILDNGVELAIQGLFVAIGNAPSTALFSNLLDLDRSGFVISDDTTTNVKNIFVAGDVRTKDVRQLVTASSDGAIAANNCINYINLNS